MFSLNFEKIIRDTINELPEEFKSQLDNVEVTVEDYPEDDENVEDDLPNGMLLGLYRGVPKNKRFSYSSLPDKITLYRNHILSIAMDDEDAKRIIHDTVLHEIGHHFGLSDEELEKIKK